MVAVSARPRAAGQVSSWPTTAAAVVQRTYLDAIWRAGADECLVAPRLVDYGWAESYLERFDGLVLVGGGDVDPVHFGAERDPEVYGVEPESDSLELALARAAITLGKPLFAICRGLQILNVALGGTLDQHITDRPGLIDHGDPRRGHAEHPVELEPGSVIAGALGGSGRIESAWSFHHQAVDRLAPGLVVTGRTADGVVEAVELEGAPDRPWTLGIQWHPERLAHVDAQNQALFDAFVTACARRSRSGARSAPGRR
jgi:putative glutamine amidotransferase